MRACLASPPPQSHIDKASQRENGGSQSQLTSRRGQRVKFRWRVAPTVAYCSRDHLLLPLSILDVVLLEFSQNNVATIPRISKATNPNCIHCSSVGFFQPIWRPFLALDRHGHATPLKIASTRGSVYRDFKNSMIASWSLLVSFSNC
jgi:hypothetical protein